ncbi:MAG TPA: hypothetical protein VM900_11255 [Sphingomonas sp.]|nr:hypothetical protein [Sphingomonas sp.]
MADSEAKNTGPLNLPMQPTGSGVADLEIAREQDALAADGELAGAIDAEVPSSPAADRDEAGSEARPN